MIGLTRWCMAHRRWVILGWIAVAVVTTVVAGAVGRQYANNFGLPGTEAQRVVDLLNKEFKAQSGDVDTIVWHTPSGTVTSPQVRAAIEPLLARVQKMPHVVSVISPYSPAGEVQVSRDQRTAFATINYDRRANLLPNNTGAPVLNAINAIKVRGLQLAAGGQVIEQAEGFNIGPATTVGVIAALVILLLTFGSLLAAGMPLVTAGLGLITGIGLVGLATHITDMANVAPELAVMIGLGVGVDYALFIVTRFRENYTRTGDVSTSVVEAMDTSGRAILLAGTTVIIALLGMFAIGVNFLYGLSVASVLAVLLTMTASLTVLPAMLSRYGARIARPGVWARRRHADGAPPRESAWRRWSLMVQSRPRTLALAALAVMLLALVPMLSLRLDSSDAGNDPANTSTYRAFNLLSRGFGEGFNGPLLVAIVMQDPSQAATAVPALRAAVARTPDIVAVTPPRLGPSGKVAVIEAYPRSAPQAQATTDLVNHLRHDVLPPLKHALGVQALVGGFTAGSIDFAAVLSSKLPLFIGIVVVVSMLLLGVIFRSLVIPIQAGLMNLLSIGGALGVTVLVFQDGWFASVLGVSPGPVEPWIPVLMFAVVFGLSMDYEVFLISRVREEWVRTRDASRAVADGIAYTGRVISAAAAIMVCVFLSFMLGNERAVKEFGFGLAAAVFLDAIVVRCVLLPAVLELLGERTWWLPRWLDARLPWIRIEGSKAAAAMETSS
ncbi:MAG TPA: MMPL family transporter [Solirubrobacteraceae bacterium]|nr:MMPL family transporter [Solirubrobacteraceae bacterium]